MPASGLGRYEPTNSRPAGGPAAVLMPHLKGSLPPEPFPLDDPAHRLTAGRVAIPLAGTAPGRREVLIAAGTIAAKKFGLDGWALTLAPQSRTRARRVRRRGERFLGLGGCCPTTLGTATAIPLALGLTFFPTFGSLLILPAGSSSPPSPSLGSALGATVSGLGVGGSKGLLASLEQTSSLARPTSPLTGARIAAVWIWAQGSGELPTAKPRTRGPLYSAPRRLYWSLQPS